MKTFIRDYFYMTDTEYRGSIGLVALLAIFMVFKAFDPFQTPTTKTDFSNFDQLAARLNTAASPAENFDFDPNTASQADFLRLGLSEKTAQSIINYRTKGGKFKKPEDFQKIYTLKPADYKRLMPFIRIGTPTPPSALADNTASPAENFDFDPNTASQADFLRLGLSEKTVQSIINYRTKGGKFKNPEDFQKIYTLKPADYKRLMPFIRIETPKAPTRLASSDEGEEDGVMGFATKPAAKKNLKIDINAATLTDWDLLPGIGTGYASRIIKFRTALGGFVTVEQVGEVQGLPDSTFQQIRPFLVLQTQDLQRMNLNTATTDDLARHPYLSKKEATLIVQYRTQHGNFQTIEDLKKIKIISNDLFNKIKPYLTIQ